MSEEKAPKTTTHTVVKATIMDSTGKKCAMGEEAQLTAEASKYHLKIGTVTKGKPKVDEGGDDNTADNEADDAVA